MVTVKPHQQQNINYITLQLHTHYYYLVASIISCYDMPSVLHHLNHQNYKLGIAMMEESCASKIRTTEKKINKFFWTTIKCTERAYSIKRKTCNQWRWHIMQGGRHAHLRIINGFYAIDKQWNAQRCDI